MLYPDREQAALLFDRPLRDLDAIMRDFAPIEAMRSGRSFNLPEFNPGWFYRLFSGGEELMLTFEYRDMPASAQVFRAAPRRPRASPACRVSAGAACGQGCSGASWSDDPRTGYSALPVSPKLSAARFSARTRSALIRSSAVLRACSARPRQVFSERSSRSRTLSSVANSASAADSSARSQ
jgi:hypothetical protein